MAETVHLYLKAAGADVKGESTSDQGKDMIEVSKFLEFVTSYEPGLSP